MKRANHPTQHNEGYHHVHLQDDAEIRTGGEFIKFDAVATPSPEPSPAIRKHTFDDGERSRNCSSTFMKKAP